MPRFEGRFVGDFTVRAPLDAVADWFADPANTAAHFGDLERWERVDPGTARFLMREHHYGVTRFSGRYTCRYLREGAVVRWSTLPGSGNVDSAGVATLRDAGGGATAMRYEASLAIDLDVNRVVAKAIGKVVESSVRREMEAFVRRMIAGLEGA